MTTYIVVIEQQQIPVPEEIGADDAKVKAALAPFFPDAANAMITRVTEGETVKINVVKRAGAKGADPLAYLLACPGGLNPAIALYQELAGVTGAYLPETILALDTRIRQAIADGEKQAQSVIDARKRLEEALSQPAQSIPLGF